LTASSTFKRIVSATLDNSLHFCSGRTGKEKVQAINVDDGITGLLITEEFGFVLVHSDRRIILYALNGKPMKNNTLSVAINVWTAFSSDRGFDYVAYATVEGTVSVFYLVNSERLYENSDDRTSEPICVALDQEYQRVVVVTAHGKMEGFQHSF
jgi:hypothetical protein